MSADNVRGWEIVRKMNIWPRSEASRANVRFWGQYLSQGHYQPTYQQARKGFIYFISLPLIFNSQNFKTARKHGKKAIGDLMANARDWRVGVNLIGLTNFISTVIGPNLTSCHLKLILVTPLGSDSKTWRFWFKYSDGLFKNWTRKKCVSVSEFTTVKHRMCKIWSTWRWTDFRRFLAWDELLQPVYCCGWAKEHRVSSRVGFSRPLFPK